MGLLIRGSVGDAVRALQENLTALGYEVDADGIYGAATQEQVKSFQDAYGLDADGAAGVNTMTKIAELLAETSAMREQDAAPVADASSEEPCETPADGSGEAS
jgi:peptidoglycan hydrolase-like protein with peptidoglycan-binding domain